MNFLFWLLFIANILLGLLTVWGSGFRSSYGAGIDFNTLLLIGIVLTLVLSLMVRYSLKMPGLSVLVVALPFLALGIYYVWEKNQQKG